MIMVMKVDQQCVYKCSTDTHCYMGGNRQVHDYHIEYNEVVEVFEFKIVW